MRNGFTAVAVLVWMGSGCGLIEAIEESANGDRSAMVQLHLTHHGTPTDGTFPDLGGDGEPRTFVTDEGWTVSIDEGFVVTKSATLVACDGTAAPVELYWGAVPERLIDVDLDLFSFGGVEVSAGEYCAIEVTYGPLVVDPSSDTPRAATMDVLDQVEGATAVVRGWAQRGDEIVTFDLRDAEEIVVRLDLAAELGEPLRVEGDEAFPIELTLSKTYDRLFDATDFDALSDSELSTNVMAVLSAETRVSLGTRVRID